MRIPRRRPRAVARTASRGVVLVFTGNGKGKTTAALGVALRALGQGIRVAVVQFLKGGWPSGETKALRRFGNRIAIHSEGDPFTWESRDRAREEASVLRAFRRAKGYLADGRHGLVVLDEANVAMAYGLLPVRTLVVAIRSRPAGVHVILTGRNAPRAILRLADLVTEMKAVKHPFDKGIAAAKGLDF
ncbi:MAG: cob(I)yrinic acid a,c-diamide adenosyltransferase [Planctomycetota bacterium]